MPARATQPHHRQSVSAARTSRVLELSIIAGATMLAVIAITIAAGHAAG